MFVGMEHFTDDTAASPAPKRSRTKAAKADLDPKVARALARQTLATAQTLRQLSHEDLSLLERLAGERAGSADVETLTVALVAGASAGRAREVITATTSLLQLAPGDPVDAVVEATMLAVDSPEVFREVFTLTRDLGVHDTARMPAGHEVKSAKTLVQSLTDPDPDVLPRLNRLAELFG